MKFRAIDVVRASGNAEEILSEERIEGELEFVPQPDGTADLMLPVEHWTARTEGARKRGLVTPTPLGRDDMRQRGVIHLGKRDVAKVFASKVGEEVVFARKGWGRVWNQRVRRVE